MHIIKKISLISLVFCQAAAIAAAPVSNPTKDKENYTTVFELGGYGYHQDGTGVTHHRHSVPGQADNNVVSSNVLTYIAGTPVVTSPYLGKRSAFNASDLIINIPAVYLDLRVLEQRQRLTELMRESGHPLPEHPIIEISGKLEAGGQLTMPYVGRTTGDVNLNSVELIVLTHITPWVSGYVSMEYDSAPPAISGRRLDNSNVLLNKGFMTIGNLDRTPFFMTIGQTVVPFGRYSTNMLSANLPQRLGRVKARMLELGMFHKGMFAAVYGFNGESGREADAAYGGNIGYRFNGQKIIGEVSASIISNMAEAEGMQNPPSSGFIGFAATPVAERITKRVPAVNVQGSLGFKQWSAMAEFTTAIATFNPADLSYNGAGAQPKALNTELSYSFSAFERPAAIALGYGWTDAAAALFLPRHRISAAFSTSLWRDTIETIEFRHEINYPAGTTAGGRGPAGTFVASTPMGALGHSSNTIAAQIGYYF